MNKSVLLFILIISSFVLSGCSGNDFNPFNPYVGSNGLVVSFMRDAPPDIVYSGLPYKIALHITNDGALDVTNAVLVVGVDDFDGSKIVGSSSSTFNIKGKKSTHFFRGETVYKMFDVRSPSIDSVSTDVLPHYILCYPYSTKAQIGVCVNTNPYSSQDRGCHFVPSFEVQPQGAPVDVVKVQETPIPSSGNDVKMRFTITISNLGKGIVTSQSKYKDLCTLGKINYEDLGFVDISAKLGSKLLDCSPSRVRISSTNNRIAVFSCTSDDMPMGTSYNSLLEVKLKYGYVLSGSKHVTVYNITG